MSKKIEKLIDSKFEEAFACFFELAKQKVEKSYENVRYAKGTLEYEVGNRYVRIWRVEKPTDGGHTYNHRSAYCFVDVLNGDILKAASWRAPAKHARGSIYAADFGISAVGPYGANYLK
jgi:hypothetical protein